MALESYVVFTISCDIPDCRERKTSGNVESLRHDGWYKVEIFGSKFELCPEHQKDLQDFLLDSSES